MELDDSDLSNWRKLLKPVVYIFQFITYARDPTAQCGPENKDKKEIQQASCYFNLLGISPIHSTENRVFLIFPFSSIFFKRRVITSREVLRSSAISLWVSGR